MRFQNALYGESAVGIFHGVVRHRPGKALLAAQPVHVLVLVNAVGHRFVKFRKVYFDFRRRAALGRRNGIELAALDLHDRVHELVLGDGRGHFYAEFAADLAQYR